MIRKSPAEQKILTEDHDLLIPLAISANVIANRSQRYDARRQRGTVDHAQALGQHGGGHPRLERTARRPTADLAPCGQSTCPDFTFLNYETGYQPPTSLGAFVRAGDAGSTDQTLAWLCASQPLASTPSTSARSTWTSTEAEPAEQVFKNGLASSGSASVGLPQHRHFPSHHPAISGLDRGRLAGHAGAEARSVRSLCWRQHARRLASPTSTGRRLAYYGMADASLQNASGAFVAPNAASIMAGLGDGSWDANGMWTPNYTNTSDAAAYAMPTVMYAVVPRATLPAAEVDALQQTVTSILAVTTNQNASLKAGLLPLPADVAAMANDEAAHGIGNGSYEAPYPHSGASSTSGSSGSSGYSKLVLVLRLVAERQRPAVRLVARGGRARAPRPDAVVEPHLWSVLLDCLRVPDAHPRHRRRRAACSRWSASP